MPNSQIINILLTDDDEDDRFFFEKALKKISIPTSLVTLDNGEALLEYLSKSKDSIPDVLFLDINMPRKNGLECLTEIKASKTIKDFPIIIYSTYLNDEVADLFYQKGAHCYLKKQDFNVLVEYLTSILSEIEKGSFVKEAKEKFIFSLIEPIT